MLRVLMMIGLAASPAAAQNLPELSLEYSPALDEFCALKQKIPPAAVEEVDKRIEQFLRAWRDEAATLLGGTVALTGLEFGFREARAAVVLCAMPSMSLPLVFSLRKYMKTIEGDKALAVKDFVD